jgi:pimeloyl-ACP methyl ester carboxylesterase
VLAVDYPSFGYSDAPDHRSYRYNFDHLAGTVARFLAARGVERYALYMQDYGVPIGFRLLTDDPGRITALMIQNGVIHLDGFPTAQDPRGELRQHWLKRNAAVDKRRTDYVNGLAFPSASNWTESHHLNPDAILLMLESERRPGVIDARNDLWFDYGSNVARYSAWQATLRRTPVPVLVLWGSRDDFFTTPGALAYLRDAPQAEDWIRSISRRSRIRTRLPLWSAIFCGVVPLFHNSSARHILQAISRDHPPQRPAGRDRIERIAGHKCKTRDICVERDAKPPTVDHPDVDNRE